MGGEDSTMAVAEDLFFASVEDEPELSNFHSWERETGNYIQLAVLFIVITVVCIVLVAFTDLHVDKMHRAAIRTESDYSTPF